MRTNRRPRRIAVLLAVLALGAGLPVARAQMGGSYGGMMGQGGMMGAYPQAPQQAQPSQAQPGAGADAHPAQTLLDYIRQQGLACMQCHAVDEGGYAPSFLQIAQYYAQHPGQADVVPPAIVQGVGAMPGGLASPDQAKVLGRLILDLAKAPR